MRLAWYSSARDRAAVTLFEEVCALATNSLRTIRVNLLVLSCEPGESRWGDEMVQTAQRLDIPTVMLSTKEFRPELRLSDLATWREQYHQTLAAKVDPALTDCGFLAGYMLIVPVSYLDSHVLLNLHPALPNGPVGTWQEVIWRTINDRIDYTGAMIHVVSGELDGGPCVTYCSRSLVGSGWTEMWNAIGTGEPARQSGEGKALFEAIRAAEFALEGPLIRKTLEFIDQHPDVRVTNVGFVQNGAVLPPMDVCRQ